MLHVPYRGAGPAMNALLSGEVQVAFLSPSGAVQFIKAARGPSASIFYGGPTGASASFDGFEAKITDDVIGWSQRLP